MALINISGLSFAHEGGLPLFQNVSLRLDTNWKLGLIGRNGRGKTTFLKLLAGEYAFSGCVGSPAGMDYFPFDAPSPEREAAAVFFSLCPKLHPEYDLWKLKRETSLLELGEEVLASPFLALSGGERTKLLLAALFLREGNFPLIDEPTNHLDLQGRQTLGAYLRSKSGFILVSHDRTLLDGCIDHVLSINRSDIELQRGNFSSWLENRERADRHEQAERHKLKKETARLEKSAAQSAEWSACAEKGKFGAGPVDRGFIGRRAAKMMRRSKAAEGRRRKAAEEKAALLRNIEVQTPLSMRPLPFHSKRLLRLDELSLSHGGRTVARDISFSLMQGSRLALCGRNGCGKSSLIRLLAGQEQSFQGTLHIPPGLRVSYVPQNTAFLKGRLKDFAKERRLDMNLFLAALHRFGFEALQFEIDMTDFSAGQKKKVLLAASICCEAHLYIWDEPLNYLDIISRLQVEKLVLGCKPTLIFVEHDQAFLERVATENFYFDAEAGRE